MQFIRVILFVNSINKIILSSMSQIDIIYIIFFPFFLKIIIIIPNNNIKYKMLFD